MLIFKYVNITGVYLWPVLDAKNAVNGLKNKQEPLNKFCLAKRQSKSTANFSKSLRRKRSELCVVMPTTLEKASDLLDCTEWDIFERAYGGSSPEVEKKYTAYLTTSELPPEVLNYINSLPHDENQNLM